MLTRLAVGLVWLLHFMPMSLLAPIGAGLGLLVYPFAKKRRHITAVNLRLCFPQMTEPERRRLARAHFAFLARSLVERGILWWASEARIRRLVRIEGEENLRAASGGPVILLVPHFVGMDIAWTRLACERDMAGMYSIQKNKFFETTLLRGRRRFGKPVTLSRQGGVLAAVRAIRQGFPFYYLPDMDYGRRDAVFVNFFGHPAATITGVSRLAGLCGAKVIPCVNRMLPGGAGYVAKLYPAWDNFPSADVAADARRMNEFIEQRILEMPEQYYWVHRRFKTRPEGEDPY